MLLAGSGQSGDGFVVPEGKNVPTSGRFRRRMTPAEIAARKAEREKRKRETPRRGPPAKAKVSRETGAWRDPTLVEFDKNATAREARKPTIFPLL